MRRRELPIATSAALLAEVVRGRAADAAVFAGLRRTRVEVHRVDTRTAVRAGQLLGATRLGSEHAIDAFLVATGDVASGAIIATTDGRDLNRLAAHADQVTVATV
jgi:predicted nucleic acid-binding protein